MSCICLLFINLPINILFISTILGLFWFKKNQLKEMVYFNTNMQETPKSKTIAPSYQQRRKGKKRRRRRRRRKTIASYPFVSPVSMLCLQCTFSFVSTPNDGKQLKVNEEICFLFVSPSIQLATNILLVFCELCRIEIEGAKSRCHGHPLLIQIRKNFLTLFLSPCGVRSNICFLCSK